MVKEPQLNDLRQTLSRSIQSILSYLKALITRASRWAIRATRWWQTLPPQDKNLLLGLAVGIALIVAILGVRKG
jgi:hypothetical protein